MWCATCHKWHMWRRCQSTVQRPFGISYRALAFMVRRRHGYRRECRKLRVWISDRMFHTEKVQ